MTGVTERDKCYVQLRLPLTYDDPRPELASERIKDGYRRWVEMRQAHRYYNISIINHLDFLDQLASVCRDYGEDEGLRWIQLQIDNERLNVPDKYQPPPPKRIYRPDDAADNPPDTVLTPEEEALWEAKQEAFYRQLGGKALATYLEQKGKKTGCVPEQPKLDNENGLTPFGGVPTAEVAIRWL
ncbi:MAG: hypothetical protein Q4D62_11850 [Planctomycetia bacterium]|nr:hypothetical protein [Planctomycetia bacterium]